MNKTRTYRITLLFLLLTAGLNSCASNLHLANRFVVDESDIHVLVLPPPGLLKTFLPVHPDSIPVGDSIPQIDESDIRFVNQVEDSIFINMFMDAMEVQLERLSVKMYGIDEMDAFFKLEERAYIFFIAQMELLEYVDEELFIARDGNINYVRREPVTVLENNVWFEFLKLNDAEFGMEVLFSVHATSDFVEGRFIRRSTGEVLFDANRFLLTQDDLNELAQFSGKQNAQNIFDYLMNLYVREKTGREPVVYYHYDVEEHVIRPQDQPGFIRIDVLDKTEIEFFDVEPADEVID